MLFDSAVQAANMNDLTTAKSAAAQIMENHSAQRLCQRPPPGWPDASTMKPATSRARARNTSLRWIMRAMTASAVGALALAAMLFEEKDLPGALKLLEAPFDPAFQGSAATQGRYVAEGKTNRRARLQAGPRKVRRQEFAEALGGNPPGWLGRLMC
jgi:hypothetical protein